MTRRRYSPLVERQRRIARFALYASLGLMGAVLVALLVYLDSLRPHLERPAWMDVDFAAFPEVEMLRGYLRVDTTLDHGSEPAGARYLASLLEAAGVDATVELLGDDHANVWAVLEGRRREALVLHSHIDTDPVYEPESWTHPPFAADIDGPWVFGRGAFDMKSVAIAQLVAFLEQAASGRRPERSLIFLATGSEEVGSDFGMKWILAQHPELAERFWGVLTEGGVVETRAEDDVKYWGIEFAQKRFVDVVLCSDQRQPLADLQLELDGERHSGNFHLRLTPEVATFLSHYAATRDRDLYRRLLSHPEHLLWDAPAFEELPIYLKAMFRDEALPQRLEQLPDGSWRLAVKFHLLPGSDFELARQRQLPAWRTYSLPSVTVDEGSADHGSPLDHPLYLALTETLEEAYPGAPVGPTFLPWTATDSRFVRAAGIPSYGFSPFLIVSFDTLRVGRPDERFDLEAFVDGVGIYRRLVARLVAGEADPQR